MLEPFRQGENEKKKKKNNEGQSVWVNGNGQDSETMVLQRLKIIIF
ncbi:hypothetical protein ACJIZ3_009046 [Penstemon smallii]|uniref:Uncharacterized protein n=1 Tax=Penstemon smallii TaxID=265156 RepID=A0ABD3TCT8_9LAMI